MPLRPLLAAVTGCALLALPALAAAGPAAASATPRLLAAFPTDRLTVPDHRQLTGRRVALPLPHDCTQQATECALRRQLNQLDGFDLDPRIELTFSRPVDPAAVAARVTVSKVRGAGPALSTGVDRVVYDARYAAVAMHPVAQLAPSTTYRLRLVGGDGLPSVEQTFTTESATVDLRRMVLQLDQGTAYRAAGIPAGSGLVVDATAPASGTVLTYRADTGTGTVDTAVPSAVRSGTYVFGHYTAPSWLTPDVVIPQRPTRSSGPVVQGRAVLPFLLVLPGGRAPAGGWPVAVFGHGFTRSDADVLLASAVSSARGLATIATDVVGHGYGPHSQWVIDSGGRRTVVPAYGRGVDRGGSIGSTDGVSAPGNPSPYGPVGSRDGLRQTVADVAALVRAVRRSPTVAGTALRPSGIGYYGQSFGGIYGTMLGGADPAVRRLVLNVAGGPVTEIARLSPSFRPLTQAELAGHVPSLLNGGYDGFTESMPLPGDAPVTAPDAGAPAIASYLAEATWLTRSGNPEAYAPLLRATPPGGRAPAKTVEFQSAFGDRTVPNPTTHALLAAGGLFDRDSLYRNDKTAQAGRNPHGFLLDPSFTAGFLQAQTQAVGLLLDGAVVDPDGSGDVWEVPIASPASLLKLNFSSPLHP